MIVYEVDISGICLVYPSTWYITGIYQTYVVHTILYGFQMDGYVSSPGQVRYVLADLGHRAGPVELAAGPQVTFQPCSGPGGLLQR